uniref:Uncharacterized protein n=1 Tax=Periophthalmus magnuspinnatus TaxID=409849 RepID=A0A3B4AYM2_9GOBI
MKRQENQMSFPTVPLFNQKKRARVPLTSAPPANEPFSFNNTVAPYRAAGIQVLSGHTSIIKVQYLQSSRYTSTVRTWICYRDPVLRLLCHQMVLEQQKSEYSEFPSQPQSQYSSTRPGPRAAPAVRQYSPVPHPYKAGNNRYVIKHSFQMRPANGMSLRILTAVIDGMRHWSQFRDKIPYLFEIFATLDSAVTLGPHGAKRFIVRDGKEFVQCVYYENEKELPRLIRGQVHRCVGNYDRIRNVLVCVSIRPALPSEQRNAQEAVRVCDAEMRALVKTLSEV